MPLNPQEPRKIWCRHALEPVSVSSRGANWSRRCRCVFQRQRAWAAGALDLQPHVTFISGQMRGFVASYLKNTSSTERNARRSRPTYDTGIFCTFTSNTLHSCFAVLLLITNVTLKMKYYVHEIDLSLCQLRSCFKAHEVTGCTFPFWERQSKLFEKPR